MKHTWLWINIPKNVRDLIWHKNLHLRVHYVQFKTAPFFGWNWPDQIELNYTILATFLKSCSKTTEQLNSNSTKLKTTQQTVGYPGQCQPPSAHHQQQPEEPVQSQAAPSKEPDK